MNSRYNLENELKPFLLSNERLEWVGCPEEVPLFDKSAYFTIPFGLFFAGFALFWMYMAASIGASFMAIFGLPFFAVGIGLAFGVPIYNRIKNRKTVYGFSKSKLYVKTQVRVAQVQTYELQSMVLTGLTQRQNNIGSILFRNASDINIKKMSKSIKHIKDSGDVYKQLGEMIARAKEIKP